MCVPGEWRGNFKTKSVLCVCVGKWDRHQCRRKCTVQHTELNFKLPFASSLTKKLAVADGCCCCSRVCERSAYVYSWPLALPMRDYIYSQINTNYFHPKLCLVFKTIMNLLFIKQIENILLYIVVNVIFDHSNIPLEYGWKWPYCLCEIDRERVSKSKRRNMQLSLPDKVLRHIYAGVISPC